MCASGYLGLLEISEPKLLRDSEMSEIERMCC